MLNITLLISALIILSSFVGIFTDNFYVNESLNWQAQSIGQDIIDLILIVPVLIFSGILSYKNSKVSFIWGGALLYLIYTFVIYSFDVHFNKLFLVYCFTLGLSFYGFIIFIYLITKKSLITVQINDKLRKITGLYFIIISVMFYFLWLSEILPDIFIGDTPKILLETGLITNPVHVLDISILLPGLFITGILVLKKSNIGFLLTPVLLTFFILMDITIGVLIFIMKQRGLEGDFTISAIMAILALFSAILLYMNIRLFKESDA